MASIKDLKKRITSTKNTQQTTKAMKMVSAAKLRRAQDAITNQRPYARRIQDLVKLLISTPGLSFKSPLIAQGEQEATLEGGKKALLVLITSDRGLCAGFNGNIIKTAQRWLATNKANYSQVELSFLGKKGYDYFKVRSIPQSTYYLELGGKVTFQKAKTFAEDLVKKFTSGEYQEIKIIFNEFRNAVTQETKVEDFLPLKLNPTEVGNEDSSRMFIVRPSAEEVLSDLLGKYFTIQAFRYMLDSQAGEHGARMSAMENATKNAEEMVRALNLEYNKQRQASITKELLEIISGSESQKAG